MCRSRSSTSGPSRPTRCCRARAPGLAGLRERVTLVGGNLEAGPTPAGGWRVAAWLPWPPGTPSRLRPPSSSAGAVSGERWVERHVIRVLIVDDEALVRAGLRMILESADDLSVVGEADDGADAVDAVRRCRPDVVLMDVRMPRLDGLGRHRGRAGRWTIRRPSSS